MNFKGFLFLLVAFIAMQSSRSLAGNPINVYVSILPQKYFVERIAGEYAEVKVLVKPGKSPGTYAPSPDQIKRLTNSDLYFRIGVPFENGLLHKIHSISRDIKIVDTRRGILLRNMKSHGDTNENHTPNHEDRMGKDPHIWMSPMLVKKQAETMAAELIKCDPENRTHYEENLENFIRDLADLHMQLSTKLAPFKGENIFVFHPVFGYFTDAYGLNQIAIETMGRTPKGKELSAIIKKAKQEKTRILFVQPQFDRNAARKIAAAINGSVISIDPLAFDYLSNMKSITNTIGANLAH
jgi:zinc transport system substrate-binding protein